MAKSILKTFILGIAAGIAISIGGTLFLISKQQGLDILGGFLFSVGLLMVCQFGFNLYTGKIGYLTKNGKSFIKDLLIILIGNFVGCLIYGYILRLMLINNDALMNVVNNVSASKFVDFGNGGKTWYNLLFSGFFCGALVFLAVDTYKIEKLHICARIFILVFLVATFIICGFDHCIANMFYFSFSNGFFSADSGRAFLSILLVIIGNSVGAIATYYLIKLIKQN